MTTTTTKKTMKLTMDLGTAIAEYLLYLDEDLQPSALFGMKVTSDGSRLTSAFGSTVVYDHPPMDFTVSKEMVKSALDNLAEESARSDALDSDCESDLWLDD